MSNVKTWVYRSQTDASELMIPMGKESQDHEAKDRLALLVKEPKNFKLVEVISKWPSQLYMEESTQ